MNEEQLKETFYQLGAVCAEIQKLGLNDADIRMGAIELVAKEIRDGFKLIANELNEIRIIIEYKS
jgi:hypothetical protein